MTVLAMNLLAGRACPPVICQRSGPAFRWLDHGTWHEADVLPAHIETALPGVEWARCADHAWRRLGDRKGAA